MQKETLSSRSAFMIAIVLIMGNNMILGFPNDVDQDTWIALLLALVPALLLAALYGRLVKLMPGRDIYEMAEAVFGRIGAMIVAFLFGAYCLHVASLTLGNYAEFVHLTSLFRTPFVVIALVIFMAGLYLSKAGIEILGKWSSVMVSLAILAVVFFTAISLPKMEFENLLPVFSHTPEQIGLTALKLTPLPYGEMVILLALMGGLDRKSSPYKPFVVGAVISGIFLVIFFIRSCGILGVALQRTAFFPTYKAASLIRASSFLERIEASLAFLYILTGVSKMAAGILGAARGAAKLFRLPSYQAILLPVAFLSAALCTNLFPDIESMFDAIDPYTVYALLFQVIIPVAIWVTAEIRSKRKTLPEPPEASGKAAAPAAA